LKKQGLIEGRYPNLFVAARIAATTGMKARHIRDRGFDKKYYQDRILMNYYYPNYLKCSAKNKKRRKLTICFMNYRLK